MNRLDKRLKITPEKVGESLHQEILAIIPLEEKIIPNSVNRGTPFVLENKTFPVSKSIFALAEVIQKKIQQADAVPEKDLMGRK
jgi:pilus assembly protein CpaE